VLLLSTIKLF